MNFYQLKEIDTIARKGTISAASKILHTSQPALSRSVQRLEAELGQQLFERTRNHLELNDSGKIVVEYARMMLREERMMREELDTLANRQRTLLVGTVAPTPVWRFTALTVERYPNTIIQLITLDDDEALERLLNRSVDIAVTLDDPQLPSVRSVPFMTEELLFALPSEHRLARQKELPFSQVDGEPVLIDSTAGFWVDHVRGNMPHSQIIEQSDRQVLGKLIKSSNLITFTSDVTMSWLTDTNRISIPIDDPSTKVTYYLSILENAPQRTADLFDWATR